jgi:hypothetical protein
VWLIRAIGQNGVDCPMARAGRTKASKVLRGKNRWIRPAAVNGDGELDTLKRSLNASVQWRRTAPSAGTGVTDRHIGAS